MKPQTIKSIDERVATPVLVIGILMLADKGIIPTDIIAMFLLTGGVVRLLFRALPLTIRVVFIFFIVGLLSL